MAQAFATDEISDLILRVALRENWLDEAERYNEMGLDFRDGDA